MMEILLIILLIALLGGFGGWGLHTAGWVNPGGVIGLLLFIVLVVWLVRLIVSGTRGL